jgi:signal transduction histidine kinase
MADLGARRQELSCANVISVLHYMEEAIGAEKAAEIVGSLGLPLSFLGNRSNWVSFEYYNRLLDALVETTRDERAPFRAAFSVKPRGALDFIRYAASSTIWAGSPKPAYMISLGSRFYERWMKIADFHILHSTPTSLKVAFTLRKGYSQTRNNCLATQGHLSSVPVGIGLPRAEVTEIACAAAGAPSCIYSLKWRNRFNWVFLLGLPLLAAALAAEIFVFPALLPPHDIVITALSFLAAVFSARSYQLWKSLRLAEYVAQERNEHLVTVMKRMERDYEQMLDGRAQLEERSRYLSVTNGVAAICGRAKAVETLLQETGALLGEKLGFLRGDFFRLAPGRRAYASMDHPSLRVPQGEYAAVEEKRRGVRSRRLDPTDLPSLGAYGDRDTLYLMPVNAPEVCEGFFIFSSASEPAISTLLLDALFENVSRQLKAALQRIASTRTIDGLLASVPASVLIFETAGFTVKYTNRHFLDSLLKSGKPCPEIVGASLFSLLPFDQAAESNIRSVVEGLQSGGSSPPFETVAGPVTYEYSVFAIPLQEGGESLAGIIMSDISEAKYFQRNLLIDQKLAALGRVASGIAHEINNPLYAVLADAEEISEDRKSSKNSRKLAGEIIEHVMNVSDVVKNLSHYSKTLRKEEKSDVDLNSVIEESLVLVGYSSNIMEVGIERDLSRLPRIRVAKGEIQQVFMNLFNNAIQAMEGKGTLSIRSRYEGGKIGITVADTGKGIKEKDLPFIYDLFFTTKKQGEGTGQGLYIVKKILTMYGAAIDVRSSEGEGAVFEIEFPVGGFGEEAEGGE